MLVSAKDMMDKARDGKYAVGQFNINNLEWTKAILNTAQKLNSPVILGVSGGAGKYMTGFKVVADMVKAMDESLGITVPVALHLDHGTYEGCYKCIKVLTSRSKKTWQRPRNWLLLRISWVCPSRQRSAQSAAKKTALSARANALIRRNARPSLIWA